MLRIGEFTYEGKNYVFVISPRGFVSGAYTDRPGLLKALGDIEFFERWYGSKEEHERVLEEIRKCDAERFDVIDDQDFPSQFLTLIAAESRTPLVVMGRGLDGGHAFSDPDVAADAAIAYANTSQSGNPKGNPSLGGK
ncbi:MAG TPA: hypothetical protein VFF38_01765 [Microvirga sp.]|nr:hypothetical protein [Microvirga sp.]